MRLLFKRVRISKEAFAGLHRMITARTAFFICVIGTTLLLCLLMNLKMTNNNYCDDSYKNTQLLIPQPVQHEDTLRDLISAGWNCTAISVRDRNNTRPTLNQSRNDIGIRENRTNETAFLVPNVVHYVWLGNDLKFTFLNYLSFLSVHRYIVPTYIFVYGEREPTGYWWSRTVLKVDNLIHVYCVSRTHAPNGQPFAFKAHDSDVLRTEIIFKFGGIYLDADVIVLKSFDPLRRYRTVMGRETSHGICNGILISAKGAPFIRMLLEQYDSYAGEDEIWADRSVFVPNWLSIVYSSYLHVEERSLHRPNWLEVNKIYGSSYYNWTDNYAIHLWVRVQKNKNRKVIPRALHDIKCTNTTIGQVARHVYYGSSSIVSSICHN